jgi:transposase-like protein
MSRPSANYPPELRERAVRLVAEERVGVSVGVGGDQFRRCEARHWQRGNAA